MTSDVHSTRVSRILIFVRKVLSVIFPSWQSRLCSFLNELEVKAHVSNAEAAPSPDQLSTDVSQATRPRRSATGAYCGCADRIQIRNKVRSSFGRPVMAEDMVKFIKSTFIDEYIL